MDQNLFSSLFTSDKEQALMVLGDKYVENIIRNSSFTKTSFILSTKRLYHIGRGYEEVNKRFVSSKKNSAVDIKDVTGVTNHEFKNISVLILSFIFFIIGLASSSIESFRGISPIMIGMAMLAIVIFFITQKKFLVIQYAGGSLYAEYGLYSDEEVHEFRKMIFQQKESLEEEELSRKSANFNQPIQEKSYLDTLKDLSDLMKQGILTQEEFDLKKAEVLKNS